MNKLEIGGAVAALVAIVSATAYISDIRSDIERLDGIVSEFDQDSLDGWKDDIEKKIDQVALFPVGTVVSTFLEPHDFSTVVGDSEGEAWVVADGRLVNDSLYHKVTGNPRVPDMRAMFIRGHSKFNEESGTRSDIYRDPGNREELFGYEYQKWSTSLPRAPFEISSNGAHQHGAGDLRGTTNESGNHAHNYRDHAFGHNLNNRGLPTKSEDDDGQDIQRNTATTGNHSHTVRITSGNTSVGGEHSHTVQSGGDSETRPNNISVYFMIRVN